MNLLLIKLKVANHKNYLNLLNCSSYGSIIYYKCNTSLDRHFLVSFTYQR